MKHSPEAHTLEKTHDLLARSRELLQILNRQIEHPSESEDEREGDENSQIGQLATTTLDKPVVKKPR